MFPTLLLGSLHLALGVNTDVLRAIDHVCHQLVARVVEPSDDTLDMKCRNEILDANRDTLAALPDMQTMRTASSISQPSVQCISDRPHGLCVVDMDKFPFAPPNMQVPESGRGVVFVIAPDESTGWTNPSIDLNRLAPNVGARAGSFWVDGAAPQYQTWLDLNSSYKVFNMQKQSQLIGVRNEITVTKDGPQVQASLLWGHVVIPSSIFISPTIRLSDHEYNRSLVVFGKTVGSWPGYRVVGADGNRTQYYSKMVDHCGGKAVTRPSASQRSSIHI